MHLRTVLVRFCSAAGTQSADTGRYPGSCRSRLAAGRIRGSGRHQPRGLPGELRLQQRQRGSCGACCWADSAQGSKPARRQRVQQSTPPAQQQRQPCQHGSCSRQSWGAACAALQCALQGQGQGAVSKPCGELQVAIASNNRTCFDGCATNFLIVQLLHNNQQFTCLKGCVIVLLACAQCAWVQGGRGSPSPGALGPAAGRISVYEQRAKLLFELGRAQVSPLVACMNCCNRTWCVPVIHRLQAASACQTLQCCMMCNC